MNKLNSLKLFVLLLVLKSTVIIPTPVAVAEIPDGNNEMIPRGVVERLLRLNRPDFMGVEKQLVIGELPTNLPVEIPQPTNTEVVGTIQRGKDNYQIELNVSESVARVESFYQQQLTKAGWKKQKKPSPKQAFAISANQKNENLSYCKSNKGPAIDLMVSQSDNNSTAVSISLDTNENHSFCRYLAGGFPFDVVEVPILKPPKATKVIPEPMRSFSSEMSNSTVTLESELNLEQLNTHYMNEMQQAGWGKTADSKNNQINLTVWTFKGEKNSNWQGIMRIKPMENQSGRYSANLIILQDK